MKKYKVEDIRAYFDIFLDDEVEAEDEIEAMEYIQDEIMDNIGNYIDIDLIEVDEDIDYDDDIDYDEVE